MRTGVPWLFFSFCPADSPQLTAFSGSLKLAAIMKPLSSENALTSPPPLSRGTALTSPNKLPLRRQPCPLLNWWIAPPRCSDRRQPMCRSKGNVPICLRHLSMYTDHYSRTVDMNNSLPLQHEALVCPGDAGKRERETTTVQYQRTVLPRLLCVIVLQPLSLSAWKSRRWSWFMAVADL